MWSLGSYLAEVNNSVESGDTLSRSLFNKVKQGFTPERDWRKLPQRKANHPVGSALHRSLKKLL